MSLEAIVARYGVAAIFLGSGVEGEAVVITGGILAHRHLVPLWQVMVASACGSCLVDQAWFFLGRHCRRYKWIDSATRKPAFAKAREFMERHPTAFVFGFRFVYGLRTISPIAIGTTKVPAAKFMILNALAAAIWGPLFTCLGFQFGRALAPLLRHLQHDALYLFAGIVLLAAALGAAARFRLHAGAAERR